MTFLLNDGDIDHAFAALVSHRHIWVSAEPLGPVLRREFLTLLGGAPIACPLSARAQQPAMLVIGLPIDGSASQP